MGAISKRTNLRSRLATGWSAAELPNQTWRPSVALRAFDQLCAGVVVTDNGGWVIEMNRAAESIVRLDDGLTVRNDRLCARRAFETAKMAKLIAGATADGKRGAAAAHMLVGRCDGLPPYVLTIAPLSADTTIDDRRLGGQQRARSLRRRAMRWRQQPAARERLVPRRCAG
jgi:hypothetical protein